MQTFENYELICVNDFSSDNTQKVIDLYAQKDERIKVLKNTERRGAAYSRNKGLHFYRFKSLFEISFRVI